MSIRLAIALLICALLGYMTGLGLASSEPVIATILGILIITTACIGPVVAVPVVACWAVWNRWKHRGQPLIRPEVGASPSQKPPARHRFWKMLALLLIGAAGAAVGESRTHPAHLRYAFSYGASESWHEVQIHHLEKGQWIEGPWVGAYALKISFPDLNGDGHEDIDVTGYSSNRVTFLYLPDNDGKKYWEIQERSGYAVSYAPGGYIWP